MQTDEKYYKSLSNDKLAPVLIETVKEQQGITEKQRADIEKLKIMATELLSKIKV